MGWGQPMPSTTSTTAYSIFDNVSGKVASGVVSGRHERAHSATDRPPWRRQRGAGRHRQCCCCCCCCCCCAAAAAATATATATNHRGPTDRPCVDGWMDGWTAAPARGPRHLAQAAAQPEGRRSSQAAAAGRPNRVAYIAVFTTCAASLAVWLTRHTSPIDHTSLAIERTCFSPSGSIPPGLARSHGFHRR